jgi:RNA polymerase sigma-70 factor, ECF subfamily
VNVQPSGRGFATDGELVRQARAGQRRAFDELIDRYQRRATSIAYRLLGNVHDALEVCQEAFVRAYRCLATLEDESRFGTWLLKIVTNLSLNHRRARRLRLLREERGLGGGYACDDLTDPTQTGSQPGARLAAVELAESIEAGLAGLPERQRAALVLFSLEQLPQRQVADILGCSVEAVKWHVFQARKKMKIRLKDYL